VTEPSDELTALIAELDGELARCYSDDQRHGLRLHELFTPNMQFYVIRRNGEAVGCGGIAFDDGFAELKRMYIRPAARGSGAADVLIVRLEADARAAGYNLLRLETGASQAAALHLYERHGYARCDSFGAYRTLPQHSIETSVFMEKQTQNSLGRR